MENIKGFKGYDKDLTCRGKEYKENTEFTEDLSPKACSIGMHFCKMPLDVFNYYPPKPGTEYTEVESTGDSVEHEDKISTNKLFVKARISISKLFKSHFEIVFSKVKSSKETTNTSGNYAHANTSGYKAHANTSGNYAHANTSGEEAIACALGYQSKAKAENGWIVIVDWRLDEAYNANIKGIYSAKVGRKLKGVKIESDKCYWFENGELKFE